jgi:hypothetical protein
MQGNVKIQWIVTMLYKIDQMYMLIRIYGNLLGFELCLEGKVELFSGEERRYGKKW